jgi:hypothetical protein
MYLMKKKLSSVATSSLPPLLSGPATARDCRIQFAIPRFYTVGVAKLSYVEYEIEVAFVEPPPSSPSSCTPPPITSTPFRLHRRYRQFRDLHTAMCARYGAAVQFLSFPGRKLFNSRSEAVSAERQRDLQTYLNRLVSVLVKVPGTPLYSSQSRESLGLVATFFQTVPARHSSTDS